MPLDEDTNFFNIGDGCPAHGETQMRECRVCGIEFCAKCFPGSNICAECAQQIDEDEDHDREPDFEDVSDLNALLVEDEAVEKIIQKSDMISASTDFLLDEETD